MERTRSTALGCAIFSKKSLNVGSMDVSDTMLVRRFLFLSTISMEFSSWVQFDGWFVDGCDVVFQVEGSDGV